MFVKGKIDRPFLIISTILIVGGFLIFSSAALGLFAKGGATYSSVAFSQVVLGLCLGTVAMFIVSRMNPAVFRKMAFFIFLLGIILNILVFVPGLGFEHGGAKRWLSIGSVSLQPAEVLKLAFVIYFAAWVAKVGERIKYFRSGFLPLVILFMICGGLLLLQPDTDNFSMIIFAGLAMFIAAGGRWRFVFLMITVGILGLGLLALTKPYIKDRLMTYINPKTDVLGSSFQLRQSLIAVGSGGFWGRGFGQSVQKFTYLPEPMGDSIFAVAAEEFGFVGGISLLLIFVLFATRGLKIAMRTKDNFSRLLVVGIVIMIVMQAFVNIGAMLGVVPLSGITLPFISHGGTSLFFTLLATGMVMAVSRTKSAK